MKTFLRFLCLTLLGVIMQYGNVAFADSNRSVGSPKGKFQVSSTGGAVYSVAIDAPKGLGKIQPNISLTYNSQSGYGIVGYGMNVSGISVITRGCKDIYHDGYAKSSDGLAEGAYFLDGKRLIKQSSAEGMGGAVYVLEGDPFTKVCFNGSYSGKLPNVSVVVKTKDGLTCSYGANPNSRLFYVQDSRRHIQAWYIDKVEDVYGNTMTYTYTHDGNCVYPEKITYGTNSNLSSSSASTITFEYQSILNPNTQRVTLGGKITSVGKRLSYITTATGNEVYRKYVCEYDSTLDASKIRYSRLAKVTEINGQGECFNPIEFEWKGLPGINRQVSNPQIDIDYQLSDEEILNKGFISADINGDGLADVIKLANTNVYTKKTDGYNATFSPMVIAYFYLAQKDKNGKIAYHFAKEQRIAGASDMYGLVSKLGGESTFDFNGDGKADLLVPEFEASSHQVHDEQVVNWVIFQDDSEVYAKLSHLSVSKDVPLYVSLDVDKDGRDEIVYVEKSPSDGKYLGGCLHYASSAEKVKEEPLTFTFPKNPQKMFAGDFNADGMVDLLFVYDGGYKIYYNNGTDSLSTAFAERKTASGSSWGDDVLMLQGDFNGDGLVDIAHCDNSGNVNFALNNGDGTFTTKYAVKLDMVDKNTGQDNDKFELIPADMDGDGKTDLLALKADYRHHGGLHHHYTFRNTQVAWLRSTGEKLVQEKVAFTDDETDAVGGNIIVGDFTGDGQMSIMAYGKNIYTANASDSITMRLYTAENHSISSGKINKITDGLGNITSIEYASLTDSVVCLPTITSAEYPVVDVRPDMAVVKCSQDHNLKTEYHYGGLKVHAQGLGLMGFERTQSRELSNDKTTESIVEEWNPQYFVPQKVATLSYVGDWKSSSTSTISFAEQSGTYFSYPKEQIATDYDGNVTTTSYVYDVEKGCPLVQKVTYGSDAMYKKTEYKGYVKRLETWLPTTIVSSQKHEDAKEEYASTTLLSYDEKGQAVQTIDHAGTPLAITTTNVYDSLGNITSSKQEGYGMATITKHYEYDDTNRFLAKEWQTPASSVMQYNYDTWGNVLSVTDMTDVEPPLTTFYLYDGWGNLTETVYPTGAVETSSISWGTSPIQKYCIEESGTDKPTVKTWYDSLGQKTHCEYPLPCGTLHKETYLYNVDGQVKSQSISDGKLSRLEFFTYDKLGRIIKDRQFQSGKTYDYTYGNRSVTTTIGNKTYTKTMDAWGNVKTSSDPVSSVSYLYNSMGKPVEIECDGAKTFVGYDAVGNKTFISDPDAGSMTYEYAADGKVLEQTDARGFVTTYTYDAWGRLAASSVGDKKMTRIYGTSGNENLQLVKTSCGSNYETYTYDTFGRLTSKVRVVEGDEPHQYTYQYNKSGKVTHVVYPGGLPIDYVYDANGYLVAKKYNGTTLKSLTSYDGVKTKCQLLNEFGNKTVTLDKNGHAKNICFSCGNDTTSFEYEYDSVTDNLLSRTGMNSKKESFTYDDVDRLTSVSCDSQKSLEIKYASDGNILNKLDVGNYEYGLKPHAVIGVDDTKGVIPSATLSTEFNALGKIECIDDGNSLTSVDFVYGPDMQRWKSTLCNHGVVEKTTFYDADYDKVIDSDGSITEFIYVDDHIVMMRKGNGTFLPYVVVKDNLGSIISIYAGDGAQVYSASYDAWGKQNVTMNKIGFIRGYCGHEMLNDYQIINMNGRLYDPVLGRFLSPDNYVQTPDFSQNFNRYSYCLNNPLKYTDPSGEYAIIDDLFSFFVGGAVNLTVNLFEGNVKNLGHGLALFALGGVAGECALYGQPIASAGLIGFGNSVLNQGFANGFNNIDWGQVGISSIMSLCTYAVGSEIGERMSGIVGQLTSKISDTLLRNVVDETITNTVSGFTLGTFFGLVNGEQVGDALLSGLSDAGTGAVIGSISGLQKGFVEKKEERKITILKMRSEANSETTPQVDPNVLTQEMLNNPKMPVGEGTNTVYVGLDGNGVVRYVGITNREPVQRFQEHWNSGTSRENLTYHKLDGTGGLSRLQARIIEQRLINAYGMGKNGGQLYNKINSIKPGYSWFRYGIVGN